MRGNPLNAAILCSMFPLIGMGCIFLKREPNEKRMPSFVLRSLYPQSGFHFQGFFLSKALILALPLSEPAEKIWNLCSLLQGCCGVWDVCRVGEQEGKLISSNVTCKE